VRSADPSGTEYDRENDRNGDRKNDRDSGSEDRPIRSARGTPLNQRQRWFLEALRSGLEVRAEDLRNRLGVSEKTARRDLAALKARRLISFSGSRRRGRYRLGS
jgi:predicted HTH transcriptional regulator